MSDKTFGQVLERSRRSVPPQDGQWGARRKLADALRELTAEVASSQAPEADCEQALALLQQAKQQLSGHDHRRGLFANTVPQSSERYVQMAQELNPLYGLSNALSPPLEMWHEDGEAVGRVYFDWPYEGPPGCVHGGFVAAALDQFLGFAQTLVGKSGMTGKLELRYLKPTPICSELTLRAKVTAEQGRVTHTEGTIHSGDVITARAKAMFVAVPPDYLKNRASDKA